ncbi:MAG TPA: hypothetical protein VGD67_28270 [Pseudonocardiaceae bacterium]
MPRVHLLVAVVVLALFAGGTPAAAAPVNHALGRYAFASTVKAPCWAYLANDGSPYTEWVSTSTGGFPQHLTVDFGHYPPPLTRVVVKLNPALPPHTLILSVSGAAASTNPWTYLAPVDRPYAFEPATGNTVTIPVTVSSPIRYLRIWVTNPLAREAYLAEVEAYSE